eukprot:SAG31_NODE_3797_length_3874_cov_2.483444_3_plen_247_part_00
MYSPDRYQRKRSHGEPWSQSLQLGSAKPLTKKQKKALAKQQQQQQQQRPSSIMSYGVDNHALASRASRFQAHLGNSTGYMKGALHLAIKVSLIVAQKRESNTPYRTVHERSLEAVVRHTHARPRARRLRGRRLGRNGERVHSQGRLPVRSMGQQATRSHAHASSPTCCCCRCRNIEKEYFRLNTAPDPAKVRPPDVLAKSLRHVQQNWVTQSKDYEWVTSQMKAIRQDLVLQNIHVHNSLLSVRTC